MTYTREYLSTVSPEKLSRHIGHFSDVHTEWQTIQSQLNEGVPRDDILFYGRESLMKFILEFAAATKQTSVTYQIKSDGIHARGIKKPVRTMFENAAEIAGYNSREEAELIGWQEAERMIGNGSEQFVLISPPSIEQNGEFKYGFGSYGFLFYFTRDENNRLKNTVLRYKEDNSLATSRLLGYSLNLDPSESEGANGFLKKPIDVTQMDKQSFKQLLRYVGYSENDNRAQQLEQELLSHPDFIFLYKKYMKALMSSTPDFFHMKELLDELYTQAYLIIQSPFPPPIFDGGSCPVTIGFNYGFGLPRYKDFSTSYETRVTSCPTCTKKLLISAKAAKSREIRCPCGNSTTCPDAIYDASKQAMQWELDLYQNVETWD